MDTTPPESLTDALVQALTLAITAPTDEQAQRAVAVAERIAAQLPETEVARAKKRAQHLTGT